MGSGGKRLAYFVLHKDYPDQVNLIWSESRGKARWAAIESLCDAFNCPPIEALTVLRVRRAPKYDYLGPHEMLNTPKDKELVDRDEQARKEEEDEQGA